MLILASAPAAPTDVWPAVQFYVILHSMQGIESQMQPLSIVVAFFLLVFGTMREFLQPDSRRFMLNLLQALILVCLISNWSSIKQWTTDSVNGLSQFRINVGLSGMPFNDQQTKVQPDLAQLRQMIEQKVAQEPQNKKGGILDFFNPAHLLALVLWAIYFGTLHLCAWIIAIMNFLQQAIVVFLDLYVPVALAEFSVQNLRSQAEAFFKTYIGVLCWPIGWVFANIVTLALLQALRTPNSENAGEIVLAIVWSIPILLWVVIGHVVAPLYAQKVVVRGGAELQAFTGAMLATVGGSTGAAYAGALRFGAGKMRGFGQSVTNPRTSNEAGSIGSQGQESFGWADEPRIAGSSAASRGLIRSQPGFGGLMEGWSRGLIGTGAEWGAKAHDFGGGVSETGGNLASTVGSMIVNASGNRIGPEAYFRFGSFRKTEPNGSSQRARSYLK
jgi:hypothetical protein